ncbi:capsule biosynthesis GfcC family protein [Salinicola halimionae]|uniref:capsule biosynthesis GfcC family protein n=1 Tax=Salinicola halimionae TaxID=1949081 RepID=UPI000DA225C9|nr:capsule biosynthesis GfcC family protein [Salinicola halimionae]
MVTPHNRLPQTARWILAIALWGLVSTAEAQDDTEPTSTFTIDIEGHQPPSQSPSLLDAWLTVEREAPVNWSRAFVVRDALAAEGRQRQRRLETELDGLAMQARLLNAPAIGDGLESWREALNKLNKGRVPGRVDPTWLMAHLRQVPRIEDVDELGWCSTPDWVEAWTPLGVKRLAWQPGMTTDTLMDQLPKDAYARADTLQLVTPQGEIRKLGIAAWNHDQAPLVPGIRAIIALPLESVGAQWVDMALPQFLSTRLPGDDCITVDPANLYQ